MKAVYPQVCREKLCRLFGISRQAYYQYCERAAGNAFEATIVLKEVKALRQDQRRVGTRKLLVHLKDVLERHSIKLGRDALFNLLREHGLLIRRRHCKVKTTDSHHPWRRYPNLIKEFTPEKANQLWVGDITYLETGEGFVYLFLITDAYSHKVVGYCPSLTLEAGAAMAALRMALQQLNEGEQPIHHSDRGSQYCSTDYTALLSLHGLSISMTENGDPYENAVAERINGILKNELIPERIATKNDAIGHIHYFVNIYNNVRLHNSVDNLTPQEAHLKNGELRKLWKKRPPVKTGFNPIDAKLIPPQVVCPQGQAQRVLTEKSCPAEANPYF
jgi:putative transposase